jgi:hypothetical protein
MVLFLDMVLKATKYPMSNKKQKERRENEHRL